MRFLLVGNYGVGNIGDEALLLYFQNRFPDVEWLVVSMEAGKGYYPRIPCGLRSLFRPWWRTIAAIRSCDGVVFGGGTLFTDVESVRACLIWWWHAAVARLLGAPLYLAFQGVGPFRTRLGERLTRHVCGWAQFLSLRDEASARRVQAWGLKTKVIQSYDPVFSFFEEQKAMDRTHNVLSIVPRHNSTTSFRILAEEAAWRTQRSAVRILSLQPDDPAEKAFCHALARSTGAEIYPIRTIEDLKEGIAGSSHVLTQRYHGAVAALSLGIPFDAVPQEPGDKLDSLPAAADMPEVRASIAAAEGALRAALGLPERASIR